MSEEQNNLLEVAVSPHIHNATRSTRSMMTDVLIALVPLVIVGISMFGAGAIKQLLVCTLSALAAEAVFTAIRKKPFSLMDGSAAITGLILALSLPATAPWYVGVIGGVACIGLGKIIFGGLGFNIFNPAMVGRAFVMFCFPALLGAGAYVLEASSIDVLTSATPLTAFKMEHQTTNLMALFLGHTNGSIGEVSALACLVGGAYLCIRRTAAWQIPAGSLAVVAVVSFLTGGFNLLTVLIELSSGALLFGTFYIATDPVTSPVTPKGRWIFGIGFGLLVMMGRKLSGYPEWVMFAILVMNAITPLINRWTIPTPVGGPVPVRK